MPTHRPPLPKWTPRERRRLLHELNYLNVAEVKSFCRRHSIPYTIFIETGDGGQRPSGKSDRKGVILGRVRHFLQTGEILPPTIFPARVIAEKPLAAKLTPAHRLYYGQYNKQSRAMSATLANLTGGRFRH